MTTATRKLNARQLAFCREYVDNSGNGSAAARDAGYSEQTASEQAYELLKKPQIEAEIARLKAVPVRTSASIRSHVLANLQDLSVNGVPDSARVAATVALGKTERMFVDVTESAATSAVVPALKTYTLEELVELRAVLVDGVQPAGEPLEDVRVLDTPTVPQSE